MKKFVLSPPFYLRTQHGDLVSQCLRAHRRSFENVCVRAWALWWVVRLRVVRAVLDARACVGNRMGATVCASPADPHRSEQSTLWPQNPSQAASPPGTVFRKSAEW